MCCNISNPGEFLPWDLSIIYACLLAYIFDQFTNIDNRHTNRAF